MTEWKLSKKIEEAIGYKDHPEDWNIKVKDVKEFIRRLKDELGKYKFSIEDILINRIIDGLAGEELKE